MSGQLALDTAVERSAVFSDDRVYRYALRRIWDPALAPAMFIGLNPSTADETEDDPTVRRCIRFARDWGYGGLLMSNLFAYRATDPEELMGEWWDREGARNPVGEREETGPVGTRRNMNDVWLERLARRAGVMVAAWGAHPMPQMLEPRPGHVQHMLGPALQCLGTTKAGHPRHPLYLKADTRLQPLRPHVHEWGPWEMGEQSIEHRWCKTCGRHEAD